MEDKDKKRKTIALALGGGGARGFAHVGMLEVLEREGIKVDYIAGTSMGAIMGGMYASGYPISKIKEIVRNFKNLNIIPTQYLNVLHESMLKSTFVKEALEQIFQDKTFEECKIPFYTLAVDLESGKEVIFNSGSLKDAILASASIPLIFPPTFHKDRYLIDGGVLNNVPVTCLRALNPDILIGSKIVNYTSRQYISGMVYAKYHQKKYKSLFKRANFLKSFVKNTKEDLHLMVGIALRAMDIAAKDSTDRRIEEAAPDLMLEPNIQIGLLEFSKADQAIEEGRRAMEEALPKLKEILDK
ncbi:patatin-like phospholipase family protein [Patescibacteria group bacterium]